MNYESSSAFRRALEDRLQLQSIQSGVPLIRLRKMVAFERFLVRLIADQPEDWVLKGGFALQLRLGARARTTQDIDLLLKEPQHVEDVHQSLVHAARLDLADWFEYEVGASRESAHAGLRFHAQSLLGGRAFEDFHIDIGSGDPMVEPPEPVRTAGLLEFAGIHSSWVPCYSLTQQIAEKVHAYTRPHSHGASTRVKDWVDTLLMAEMSRLNGPTLLRALQATFSSRGTHPLPARLPRPSADWSTSFRRMTRELNLAHSTLEEAHAAIACFLDPVLSGQAKGTWEPITWSWQ